MHCLVPSHRRCGQLRPRPLRMHRPDLGLGRRGRQRDCGRDAAVAVLRGGRTATASQGRLWVLLGGTVLPPHGCLERHRLAGLPLQGRLQHKNGAQKGT